MTVEELIEELKTMPPTAVVFVVQYEDLDFMIEGCDYLYGRVVLETEPWDADDAPTVFTDGEGD